MLYKWKSKESWRILISDKTDLKIKKIARDKEGHYITIKGLIQKEDITIVNIYACNIGASQYIRQIWTDIKGEIDSNIITVRYFNAPLTTDRSSKQKIKKHEFQMIHHAREISLIYSGHSIQIQKNATYFQVHMQHSLGETTSWFTNQTSVNLRKLKLYQVSFLTTMPWD